MVTLGATYGWFPVEKDKYDAAVKSLKTHATLMNNYLNGKEWIVGNQLTVADIILGTHMSHAYQTVLDGGYRKAMGNLTKWVEKIINMPEFIEFMGKVKFCSKAITPTVIVPAKKEEVKAAPKKVEEKKTEEAPKKKEENPLDLLPPTSFDLFNFKTFFVNLADKRGEGMKAFYEQYDREGYSIYFVHYDKYEGEGEVLYQTANMLNGFLQRADHFRKHCFATMAVLGEEPKLEI